MREILLAEHRGQLGAAKKPQTAEVARFKDENATARVVTASQSYVVYSLKNRSSLRVLPRKASQQTTQMAYKKHSADVTGAQFVNNRSNVVASTSAKELMVWYVDDDNQIHTYFSFPREVSAFAWVPVANSPPDLLVLVKNGATHTAGILKASELIVKSTKSEAGVVGTPDGTLIATDSDMTTLRTDITCDAVFATAASPIVAYSVGADSIVTASLGNPHTPAWQPCDGDRVTSLAVLPNELLVAACDAAIYVWDVAAEPRALQRFALGPRRCMALHCTSSRAAAFLTTGNSNACEAMVLNMQPKIGAAATAFYDINCRVSVVSSCVVAGATEDPRLHVDGGNVLQVCLLQDAAWNPLDVPVASPVVVGKAQQQQQQAPAAAAAAVAAPSPPSIRLPGIAGVQNPEIDALRMHIETALSNTASMLAVSQSVVTKDHNSLVQEALKAQAKTLATLAASQTRPGHSGGAIAGGSNAFDAVLEGITEPVATALVEGISAAIEDQLRTQLDQALRHVLTRQEKRKQKDQITELRGALDGIVAGVMAQAQDTIRDKQVAYASRLMHYVSDVASEGASAISQLQQVIVAQQQQLAAIEKSGLLEEVKALRAEVAALKARGGAAAKPVAAVAADMPPETVLANAQAQLAAGAHALGLNWVLQFNDAAMVVRLLISCAEETRNNMLEDSTIPTDVWSRLVGFLASTPRLETLEPTLAWLFDIIAEKPELMKNDQLAVAVNSFLNSWKSNPNLDQAAKDGLRKIVMLIRR
jgi:hypothetical protein